MSDYADRWCPMQERMVLAIARRAPDGAAILPKRRGALRWRCSQCGCDLGAVTVAPAKPRDSG